MNRFGVISSTLFQFKQNMISKIILKYISSRKYFTFFPHKMNDGNLNVSDA